MCKFNEILMFIYGVISILNFVFFWVCMGIYFGKISSPICPDNYVYVYMKHKCRQCLNENVTLIEYLNCKNGIPPEYVEINVYDEVHRQIALIGIYVSISIFILNGILNIKKYWCNCEYEKPAKTYWFNESQKPPKKYWYEKKSENPVTKKPENPENKKPEKEMSEKSDSSISCV